MAFMHLGCGKYIEKEAFLCGTNNKPVGYVASLNLTSESDSKEATKAWEPFCGVVVKRDTKKEHIEIHKHMAEIYAMAGG